MNPLASGPPIVATSHRREPQVAATGPQLTASQFKLSRQTTSVPKRKPAVVPDTAVCTDPRLYHKQRMAEFARDWRETLPNKRAELEAGNLDTKRRMLLEAQICALESRHDEKLYVERVSPLLAHYEECLKGSRKRSADRLLPSSDQSDLSNQLGSSHFGLVQNKELTAAKNAFFMETLGYVPNAEGTSATEPGGCSMTNARLSCSDCAAPLVVTDGYDVCIECGAVPVNSCSDYQISYRDTQDMMVKQAGSYKRSARFSEWLSSMQAKENTQIPASIFDAIMKEIARERITDLALVDSEKVRDYLCKMRQTRFYDHVPRIIKYINGIPPVVIPPDIEAQLNIMFSCVEPAFEEVISHVPSRKSFISYPFTLRKFCELLGRPDLAEKPLLKCKDKLRFQEMIWEGMCEIVGWPFIPSI